MSKDTLFTQQKLQSITLLSSLLLCALNGAETLTLAEAHQLALLQNPSIEAIHSQHRAMSARIDSADALPNPQVKVTYFGESVETRTGPQQAIYSIQQTVPWLTKLSTQKNIARIDAEIILHAAQSVEQMLLRDVSIHYAEASYQEIALELTDQSLQWIERAQEVAEENVRNGRPLNDVLQFELELERTLDMRDQQQQRLEAERAELAALLGTTSDRLPLLAVLPEQRTEKLDSTELKRQLRHNNPELLAMKRSTASAAQATELNRLKRYPDLTFGVNYIQVGEGNSNFSDAGEDPWNVSIGIQIPLWEKANRAHIRAAKANQRASTANYRNRLLELTSALSNAVSQHGDNLRRMQRYVNRLIPLAEQALENTQFAYESDQVDVLDVIQSERILLDLQINYWRACADTAKAHAEIQALTKNISK